MKKLEAIYSGKSKTLYKTDDENLLICEFRDDATAFNGQKHAKLSKKGELNNAINAVVMQKLAAEGIQSHFVEKLNNTESLVRPLKMIPIECVIRNLAAGNLCKRYGIEKGRVLNPPTFEFFLKDDKLGDPMVNEYHIETFNWATKEQLQVMKQLTFQINNVLRPWFEENNMLLVDYKLEFGLMENGAMILGDEFTPDGCRLWDATTKEVLDKDRFRQDLGQVIEHYEIVAKRLGAV